MDIKIRDALLAGMFVIIGAIISPIVTILLESSNEPPVIVDFSSDLLSPQKYNKSITWTASARDPDNDIVYYKFLQKGNSTGYKWIEKQGWSQKNSWEWNTNISDTGNNSIQVLVKDNNHVLSDIGDDGKSQTYTIKGKPRKDRSRINDDIGPSEIKFPGKGDIK